MTRPTHRLWGAALAVLAVAALAHVAAGATAETTVLTVEAPEVRIAAGGAAAFNVTLDIKPPYHTMAHKVANENLVPTTLTVPEGNFTLSVVFPDGKDYTLLPGTPPIKVYGNRTVLRATLTAGAGAAVGKTTVPLVLAYQACDDRTCLPPEEVTLRLDVEVLPEGTPVASAPPGEFAIDLDPEQQATREQLDWAYGEGFPLLLLIVFGLGLVLNATPCVFPLLPVTMGFFASQGESRPSRTFPLALLYVLSITAVFTPLGMAAALAGGQVGAFLSSLTGRVIMSAIMLVLAASLFGAFEIRLPTAFLARFQGKAGWVGAVLMGLAVGLIATPCIGPPLAALIAFVAQKGNPLLGGTLFFALALGMGLPYLVLGMFTGLINKVPRGGGYLIWVRRVMALPLVALVVYFLRNDLPRPTVWTLYAAVAMAGAVYLGLVEGWTRRPWSKWFVVARGATAALLVGLAVGAGAVAAEKLDEPLVWKTFTDGDLKQAADKAMPAVVYFNGKACPYCDVMERTTFRGPEVLEATRGVALLKADVAADLTGRPAELREQLNISGPPRLLFFDRTGTMIVERGGAVAKPEFLEFVRRIKVK